MGTEIKHRCSFFSFARLYMLLSVLLFSYSTLLAQDCPPNIDFESGTLNNWTCYTGTVAAVSGDHVFSLSPSNGPISGRHTIFSRLDNMIDPYGGFPVTAPNGSGYSVRLGNDQAGGQAEGISYEFRIPSDQDYYSLIYHYAVVFQDPNHQIFQQPRLEIEITNVTDNQVIHCSSFTFIPYGSILPGFFVSPIVADSTSVWCKNWTAVSINLNGHAGKTIRLFFKTGDCTFIRHFGYAYIDVNTECSSEFVGAAFCPDDTGIQVTAPWGYQNYQWFNESFTQKLGSDQSINFSPPPAPGTRLAVEVTPYEGYGCLDTLYTTLMDTLTIQSNAGDDILSCNETPVPIGANPKPGLFYHWTPTTGLSDPNIANPLAGPPETTAYILTTTSYGGGCATRDTVIVTASIIDTTLTILGKDAYCIGSGDSTVLILPPATRIEWFRDDVPINIPNTNRLLVTQSGEYHATLYNNDGCSISTLKKSVFIEEPIPGIRYPVQYVVQDYSQQLTARDIGIAAEWSPGTFLSDVNSYTPIFDGEADMQYTIALQTRAGCLTVDTMVVMITKQIKIHVPTAFTPNNDGLNDYFKPIPMGIRDFKSFRIYNRWGQMIFDLKFDPRGWDGTINGRPQGSQVFVWVAEGVGVDNRTYIEKGTFTLVR